jgi:RNA polymerase sigma-70 factor (ECF subfamily)
MADRDGEKAEEARRRRFLSLLGPLHDRARLSARRLCRSNADGDDLFQEAAWFYAVLLSVHRERSRRGFWTRFFGLDRDKQEEAAPPRAPHALEDDYAEASRLKQALSRLPAEQREAVVLFEVDGYSLQEVAELQGSSVGAVKSRLLRGRQRLRQALQAAEETSRDGAALAMTRTAPVKETAHGRKQTAAR